MDQNPFIVIMAGGVGTRFWPYSRVKKPKQFLDVLGTGKTLLQMTYERFLPLTRPDRIYVVTNKKYQKFVFEQLPDLSQEHVLAEPLRRNTATCVAYACYKIRKIDPEARLIVTPSDHLILKEQQFQGVMQDALAACTGKESRLLTIGIQPNRPETGFGYIQYIQRPDTSVFKVKTFTEKPDEQLAQAFIDSGDFVWNAGIFVWTVSSIIRAFEQHLPEVAEAFEEGEQYLDTADEPAFIKRAYSLVKNVSIDIGILEKATNVYTLLADVGWSDLGSWMSLHDVKGRDTANNVVDANALLFNTKNSYLRVSPQKLLVVENLDGYLVNETENVILICRLENEKKFRKFVAAAREKGEDFV